MLARPVGSVLISIVGNADNIKPVPFLRPATVCIMRKMPAKKTKKLNKNSELFGCCNLVSGYGFYDFWIARLEIEEGYNDKKEDKKEDKKTKQ